VSSDEVHGKVSSFTLRGNSGGSFIESGVKPGSFVHQVENSKNEKGKSDEAETKYLSTSEGSEETNLEVLNLTLLPDGRDGNILILSGLLLLFGLVLENRVEESMEIFEILVTSVRLGDGAVNHLTEAAVVGGSGISEDSNLHANVARGNRSESTNQEGDSSVGEVGWVNLLVDLSSIDGKTDNEGEDAAEERQVNVLSFQELFGTIYDESVDIIKILDDFLSLFSDILVLDGLAIICLAFFLQEIDNGLFFIGDRIDHEIVYDTPGNRSDGDCHDEVNGPGHLEHR
jgi:hypothetical protein